MTRGVRLLSEVLKVSATTIIEKAEELPTSDTDDGSKGEAPAITEAEE